jgi:hypothetical protein
MILSNLTVVFTLLFSLMGFVYTLETPVGLNGLLESFGAISPRKGAQVFRNLDFQQIYEHELADENVVTSSGAVSIDTGRFTGRSPKDKYFVDQHPSNDNVRIYALN